MKLDWKVEGLPALPSPWFWERGEIDGDPVAVREVDGYTTWVYESVACRHTENLTISTIFEGEKKMHVQSNNVPFSVLKAVNEALHIFYEKDLPKPEPSFEHKVSLLFVDWIRDVADVDVKFSVYNGGVNMLTSYGVINAGFYHASDPLECITQLLIEQGVIEE